MKEKVTGTVEKLDENTNKTWAKMMKTIKEESKGGMENAKEQFRFHGQQIVKGWERLKGDAKEKFGGMKKNISDKMEETGTAIRDKWDAVMEFFGGIDLSGTGRDMIQGLIGGIKSKAGDLVNAAKGVVNDAIQGAKNLLGISSPSRVFMKFGRNIDEGLIVGIDSLVSKVARASRKMVDAAMPGALAMPDIPMGSFYRGAPSCRVTDTDIDYDSLGAIASGGTTFNGPIYVTIPAKDIKEMQDVTDFFDRLSQAARAGAT